MREKKPAPELGSPEWHKKTLAKLLALIKNSRSGNTFLSHFAKDSEYLTQEEVNILLSAAVQNANSYLTEKLLDAGADPDSTTINDLHDIRTYCLHWACLIGNYEIAGQLLEAGADPNLEDERGKTARDYIDSEEVFFKSDEVVKNLAMKIETAEMLRNDRSSNNLVLYEYSL